jgi:hypothetical protein
MSAVPVAVPVNVTEQVPAARVQVVELNEPVGPVSLNVTVPVGTVLVPAEMSATVAVQEDGWLTTTGVMQVTVVELDLALMMTLAAALVLPL